MADTQSNPSMMSHVSIGTNRFEAARAFYDAVLAPLGVKRVMEHPGVVAYGKLYPEFWVGAPFDGQPANVGNGTHFGFFAESRSNCARVSLSTRLSRMARTVAVRVPPVRNAISPMG